MARIRTIKPEFPHSESMGRVSRDARLLFVLLFTIADDDGRLRGNSSMLASLLFPYDEDAKTLIDDWVGELEREKSIIRYVIEGHTYLQILNWSSHQRIDHPTPSRLPPPPLNNNETFSETFANPREASRILARNPVGIGREGKGLEGKGPVVRARDDSEDLAKDSETDVRRHIDAIKAIYPKAARQDWITAEKLIRNIVAAGTSWSDLTEGITRYARLCAATNRSAQNPGMFFQAVDSPWLQEWPLPAPSGLERRSGTAPPRDNTAAWAELEAKAKAIGCRARVPTDTLESYRTEVLLADRPKRGGAHPGLSALTNKLRGKPA